MKRMLLILAALTAVSARVDRAEAQTSAICNVVTNVLRSVVSTCGREVLTDPVGCARRVWNENREFVTGALEAARGAFRFMSEKVTQLRGYISGIVESIRREANIGPDDGFLSQAASIAATVVRRGVSFLNGIVSSVASAIRNATTAISELVRDAGQQIGSTPEFQRVRTECGDSGNGVIAKFNSMRTTCARAVSEASALHPIDTARRVQDCLTEAWRLVKQAHTSCVPAATALATRIPEIVGDMARRGLETAKTTIGAFLDRLRTRVQGILGTVQDTVRNQVLPPMMDLAQRTLLPLLRPMLGRFMSQMMSGGGAAPTQQTLIQRLARFVAEQSRPLISRVLQGAARVVQPIVTTVLGTAALSVDQACTAGTAAIAGIGVVLSPLCQCIVGVITNFLQTALIDVLVQRVVTPLMETVLERVGEPLANSLSQSLNLDDALNRLISAIESRGAQAIRNAIPEWMRENVPALTSLLQSGAEAGLTAFATGARSCAAQRSTAGFFGTMQCLLRAAGEAGRAGGTAVIEGLFNQLFQGDGGGIMARFRQYRQRITDALTALGVPMPEGVVGILEGGAREGAQELARELAVQAGTCLPRLAGGLAGVRAFLSCLGEKAGTVLRAGGLGLVRGALRSLIDGVTSDASQARIAQLLSQAGTALQSAAQIQIPEALRTALEAATTEALRSGAQAFRTAASECIGASRFSQLSQLGSTVLPCIGRAATTALRAGGVGGIRGALSALINGVTSEAGQARITQLLEQAVQQLQTLAPGVRVPDALRQALTGIAADALRAGAAGFRTQATECISERSFTELRQLGDRLGCIATAARGAFAAAGVGAVRGALRALINGVTSSATQSQIQGLLSTAARALTGGVTIPLGLRDTLANASREALRAGAGTFRTQASSCVTDEAFTQMSQLRERLGCIATAAQAALSSGGLAAVNSLIREAVGAVRQGRQAVDAVLTRLRPQLSSVSGVSSLMQALAEALSAASEAFVTEGQRCQMSALTSEALREVGACILRAARGSAVPAVQSLIRSAINGVASRAADARSLIQRIPDRFSIIRDALLAGVGAASAEFRTRAGTCPERFNEMSATAAQAVVSCIRSALGAAAETGGLAGAKAAIQSAVIAVAGRTTQARSLIARIPDSLSVIRDALTAGLTAATATFRERAGDCHERLTALTGEGAQAVVSCIRSALGAAAETGGLAGAKAAIRSAVIAVAGRTTQARSLIARIPDSLSVIRDALTAGLTAATATFRERAGDCHERLTALTGEGAQAVVSCIRTALGAAAETGGLAGAKEAIRSAVAAVAGRTTQARSLIARLPDSLSVIRDALTAGLTTATATFRERAGDCHERLTALTREGAQAVVSCIRTALGSAAETGGLAGAKEAIRSAVAAVAGRTTQARSLIARLPDSLSVIRDALTAGLTTATATFRERAGDCHERLTALTREGAQAVVSCIRTALGSAAETGGLAGAKAAIRSAVAAVAGRTTQARSLIARLPDSLSVIRDALTAGLTTATATFRERAGDCHERLTALTREGAQAVVSCIRTALGAAAETGGLAGAKAAIRSAVIAVAGRTTQARSLIARLPDSLSVIRDALTAGLTTATATFRERAGDCHERLTALTREGAQAVVSCIRTALGAAAETGGLAGAKEAIRSAVAAVAGRTTQARSLIARIPDSLSVIRDALTAGLTAATATFRERAGDCHERLTALTGEGAQAVVSCIRSALGAAAETGGLAGAKAAIRSAVIAVAGRTTQARSLIARIPDSLSVIRDALTAGLTAATATFRERAGDCHERLTALTGEGAQAVVSCIRSALGAAAETGGLAGAKAAIRSAVIAVAGRTTQARSLIARIPDSLSVIRDALTAGLTAATATFRERAGDCHERLTALTGEGAQAVVSCIRTALGAAAETGGLAGAKEAIRSAVAAVAGRTTQARSLIARLPDSLSVIRDALTAGLTTATATFRERAGDCHQRLTALTREGAQAVVSCIRTALGSAAESGGLAGAKEAIRSAVAAVAGRTTQARSLIARLPDSLSVIRDALTAGLTTATATFRERAGDCHERLTALTREGAQAVVSCIRTALGAAAETGGLAGAKEAIRSAVAAVAGRTTQARSLIARLPDSLSVIRDALTAGLTTATATFRERAGDCHERLTALTREGAQAVVSCIRSALQSAGRQGGLDAAKTAIRNAIDAVSRGAEALRTAVGRIPADVPGLSQIRSALDSAVRTASRTFSQQAGGCAERFSALSADAARAVATCIGNAARSAGTQGQQAGADQLLRDAKQALRSLIESVARGATAAREAVTQILSRFPRIPGLDGLRGVFDGATTQGASAFRSSARACPDRLDAVSAAAARAAVTCLRDAARTAFTSRPATGGQTTSRPATGGQTTSRPATGGQTGRQHPCPVGQQRNAQGRCVRR